MNETKTIIRYALENLNDKNNGNSIFEIFCQKLIIQIIDPDFLPSSGSDAGGDGGIDGWSLLGENNRTKYAFSIDKKSKSKIESEINKTDSKIYPKIRFFTNQPIKQRKKEDINKQHSDIDVIIYDLEDLATIVYNNNELGKYIDLPNIKASITIDYLQKHNQLISEKDTVLNYIPRTITVLSNDKKNWLEISILEYCSRLPLFTIFHAPAGYGKTCTLQQLHQKILYKETETLLPPVFISLSSYEPTTLLQMIKEGMSESGDYRCNNFLLLLDGYDEVKDNHRESLIKEIAQLLENTSYTRKIIISVRENTYNISDFNRFNNYSIAILSKLTKGDIKSLFSLESIPTENEDEFFKNNFFNEFSDNIFYVVKFIDYYKTNKSIAGNVNELFTFIVDQEIERLFRKGQPDVNALESLALYMTLHQMLIIDHGEIVDNLDLKLPMKPFRFSHKSIQEYLAAKKIVKQPIGTMKTILAKGNIIIPYLTNTLGFVLNILTLHETRYAVFENFVHWCLKGKGNAKRLLQVEYDKISPSLNTHIFKAVIEQESKTGSIFEMPESLVSFGLHAQCRDENIKYLIDVIINLIDTDNYHYHTIVLQRITYNHRDVFDVKYQETLYEFFLKLLKPENIDKNSEFIYSLLYSVSYFSFLKEQSKKDIDYIVTQLLSIANKENIINNLCQLLTISEISIDLKLYFKIYKFIISRVLSERKQMAHFVPTQTFDDTYFEPIKSTNWDLFIPLTQTMLKKNPSNIWEIIKYTVEIPEFIVESDSPSSDLNNLFNTYFDTIQQELEIVSISKDNTQLIISWIICELEGYVDSKLWKHLVENSVNINLIEIAKDVIIKTNNQFTYSEIMDYFLNKAITSKKNFNKFKKEFYDNGNKSLKLFFERLCYGINEINPIYEYICSIIPVDLKNSIETTKQKYKEHSTKSEQDKILLREAYHIAFDNENLVKEVLKIFDIIGEDNISKNIFWEYYHQKLLDDSNKFVLYLFQSSYWAKEENVDKKQLLQYLDVENWSLNFMTFLINYFSRNQIDFNIFTDKEKNTIVNWTKSILDKYPLSTTESLLLKIHMTLSHVLRNTTFLINDKGFLDSYIGKLVGLIFSGFRKSISGGGIVNYEYYSLDYLDNYIQPKKIIEFICDNFKQAFPHNHKMISVCGYIKNHINEVLPYQNSKMKEEIIQYIEDNLQEFYYPVIVDCAFAMGFRISDLNIEKLSNAFILDEKTQDLAYNNASNLLRNHYHEKTDVEIQHLLKALQLSFVKCKDDFLKKTISEYYISLNANAGEIFIFYANYLMEDDGHLILNQFIRGGATTSLKTADITHLEIVNRLFLYSRAKESKSERRDGILAMALSSYRAMSDVVHSRDELNKILSSMGKIAKEGHGFIYRHIQEIENVFIERTYEPFSVEKILEFH